MHSLLDRKKKEVGVGIDLSLSYSLPQAARMFSCVGCFWVFLSYALVAICSFSFISSAWIVKDHLKNKDSVSFGLLWHCSESLDHMYRCYTFGGLGKFAEIPSSSWQVHDHTWIIHAILEWMCYGNKLVNSVEYNGNNVYCIVFTSQLVATTWSCIGFQNPQRIVFIMLSVMSKHIPLSYKTSWERTLSHCSSCITVLSVFRTPI